MPAGWRDTSKIHQPIDGGVQKQLEQRQNILGDSRRNIDKLKYLNSKTGWVKVSSAVNITLDSKGDVINSPAIIQLENGETTPLGSSAKAKANILSGGILNEQGKYKAGIFNKNAAYNLEKPGGGYRPIPGIVGFSTQYAGTYGSYQKAVIQFQANSLDQLDLLETLYLRPGMSVLVEYGHSLYVDNKGTLVSSIKTVDDFFTKKGIKGKKEIQNQILDLKKTSNYNYDGFLGTISNYSWSINDDGTYTCSADVLAQGALIESIGVIIYGPTAKQRKKDPSESLLKARCDFEEFLNTIMIGALYTRDNGHTKITEQVYEMISKFNEPLANRVKAATEVNNRPLDVFSFNNVGSGDRNDVVKMIRFSNLLDLINVTMFMEGGVGGDNQGNITEFYTGVDGDRSINQTPFLTFPGHTSVNPTVCILPNLDNKTEFDLNFNFIDVSPRKTNDILDIYVSVAYCLAIFEDMVKNEQQSDQTIFDYITRVLGGINKSSGYINDFSLFLDPDTDIYYVVDRKLVSENKPNILEVFGKKSTVRNFKIQSRITSDMSTMIAIGASASDTDAGQDSLQMQQWNQGIVDRFLGKKSFGGKKDTTIIDRLGNQEDFIALAEYFSFLNQTYQNSEYTKNGSRSLAYNPGDEDAIASIHRTVLNKLYRHSTFKDGLVPAGLIPIQVSFTLDGIGGLKIGQTFRVNDNILPIRYREKVGFIIRSINHNIGNDNTWITEVEALMYIYKKVEKVDPLTDAAALIEDVIKEEIEPIDPLTSADIEGPDLGSIVDSDRIRSDSEGEGHFGASRGARVHTGIDYVAQNEASVRSPIDGMAEYFAGPFNAGNRKGGGYIVVTGTGDYEGWRIVIGYVMPYQNLSKNGPFSPYEYKGEAQKVKKGYVIGSVNQIASFSGKPYKNEAEETIFTYASMTMVNHIHVKAEYNDKLVNLASFLNGGIGSNTITQKDRDLRFQIG